MFCGYSAEAEAEVTASSAAAEGQGSQQLLTMWLAVGIPAARRRLNRTYAKVYNEVWKSSEWSHTEGSEKAEEKAGTHSGVFVGCRSAPLICVFQVEESISITRGGWRAKVEKQGVSLSLEKLKREFSGTEGVIT